jgi:hypothetical protein
MTKKEKERLAHLGHTTFYKLPVGSRFLFVNESDRFNKALGPFIKIAPKTYRAIDGSIDPHVEGSTVVKPLD